MKFAVAYAIVLVTLCASATMQDSCKYDERCGNGFCLKWDGSRMACEPSEEVRQAEVKAKEHWVPVPCPLSKLKVEDWGKCSRKDEEWDCPSAHLQFRTDCLGKKGPSVTSQIVDRPGAVLTEDKP